jgi:hypothetical protein
MKAARGQAQEPQERPQRQTLTSTIHGSQDPGLVATVGQTLVRQGESRAAEQGEGQPEQCPELLHASPKFQDFRLELRRRSWARTTKTNRNHTRTVSERVAQRGNRFDHGPSRSTGIRSVRRA